MSDSGVLRPEARDGRPDAVVLAGGRSTRLGRDKAAVEVGGVPLLDRVLRAVGPVSARVVVAGPHRRLTPGTPAPGTGAGPVWCREDPPGGGPVAGVAAALRQVRAERVYVLAVDLPFLTADALRALAAAGPSAIAVDADGHDQGLLGIWATELLRAALPPHPAGHSWRAVTRRIEVARVRLPGRPPPETDCDTAADLAAAAALVDPAVAAALADPAVAAALAGVGAGSETGPVTETAARPDALAVWVERVRADLDLPEVAVGELLDLARDVAHGVARPAAPLTTFLVGLAAGRSGGSPADVASVTERVRALLTDGRSGGPGADGGSAR